MIRLFLSEKIYNRFSDLYRPLAVLTILFLAALLGQRATLTIVVFLALVFVGLVALIVLTRRPDWGLLAIIPVSFLVRFELGTGTNIPFNATFLLVTGLTGFWIVRKLIIDGAVRLPPSRVNAPALAFLVSVTLSMIAGSVNWIPWITEKASLPAQAGAWLIYVLSVTVLFIMADYVRDVHVLRVMVWFFLGIGTIYVISRISRAGYQPIIRNINYPSTGAMFWTWFAALAFGQGWINRDLRVFWRVFLLTMVTVALWTCWAYGRNEWVSGWLPPLVAIAVILWLRSWRLGAACTLLGGLFYLVYGAVVSTQVMTTTQEYSISSRLATFPIMLELIKANPVLGLGPANYYYYTSLYPILGWYVQFNSHNNYVDIAAQFGLLGLGLFTWMVIELARLGWGLRRYFEDGFRLAYSISALGGMAGMLVSGFLGDWFLPFLYNIGIPGFRASLFAWIFLGGLLVLEQDMLREKREANMAINL